MTRLENSMPLLRLARRMLLPACCLVLQALTGLAQIPAETGAPSPDEDRKKAAASDPEMEKRLQSILALKFDRSPASILKEQAALAASNFPPDSVELFRLRIVAGRWAEVAPILKTLPPEAAVKVFEFILKELDRGTEIPGQQLPQVGPARSTALVPNDIADLADLAPGPLSFAQIKLLAPLLRRAMASGQSLNSLLVRLDKGTLRLGGTDRSNREHAADLLIEVGRHGDAMKFMPPLEKGKETASFGLLEKHAKTIFLRGRQEPALEDNLATLRLDHILLAAPDCPPPIRERAWRRLGDNLRWLPPDVANAEIQRLYQSGAKNAAEVLRVVATQVADDRWNKAPNLRQINLELQRRTVAALPAATELPANVQAALNSFALTWIDEADYSKRLYVPPRQQSDEMANSVFYGQVFPSQQPPAPAQNPNQSQPVPIEELLRSAPDESWRAAVDATIRARILALEVELQLKVERVEKVVPLIEQLAPLDAKEGLRVANEFLRVWANVQDPHRSSGQRQNGYYGQAPASPGIALTRALQRRNLEELADILRRFEVLPMAPVEQRVAINAFTKAHSQAEVFQQASIENVFGKLSSLDLKLLAELAQTMRGRLAGQWRKPAVQQQAKTQRTDAQINAEIAKGYDTLAQLIDQGLARQSDDWHLSLEKASTLFDWAEFQYGLKVDLAVYVEQRNRAFAEFERAASLYAAALSSMPQKEETPLVYRRWLNSNLGASDLAQVTRQQEPQAKNLDQIRNAILALPGEASKRHFDLLAKVTSDSIGSTPSHLKPVYLRATLAILQDSPGADRIREAVAYYDGLLQEIELDVRLDGDAAVGHDRPFGAFLSLHHTADLERESAGGFGKYLRNDAQSQNYFSYNGTPPVDHRDLLEKQIRERLADRFEIVSITFQDDKVQSRGYGRAGWRETPLAYLLLKAKDAAVDRLPPLRLDMDFNDRQGAVVLPVESGVQLIDAKTSIPRPFQNAEAVQILDERHVAEGKLSLEVKVTGIGLPPEFEDLFSFDPGQFKIEELSDGGPAVQSLDSTTGSLVAASERTWMIKMNHSGSGGNTSDARFHFPKIKASAAKVSYKRYQDMDLVEVAPEVALAGLPLSHSRSLIWALSFGGAVAAIGLTMLVRRKKVSAAQPGEQRYRLPAEITPFNALQLLRKMHSDQALRIPEADRSELAESIASVEAFYFTSQKSGAEAPNLSALVQTWLARLRSS